MGLDFDLLHLLHLTLDSLQRWGTFDGGRQVGVHERSQFQANPTLFSECIEQQRLTLSLHSLYFQCKNHQIFYAWL